VVPEIAFEISMEGKYGLDINDPKETHVLRSLTGRGLLGAGAGVHHLPASRGSSRGLISVWSWAWSVGWRRG